MCHELPTLRKSFDERVEFIQVDFAPPEKVETALCMEDKWRKLAVGMVRVGELRPRFVMIMDADDLVSNRIVQFAKEHPDANGWDFDMGYRYAKGSRWIFLQHEGFSGICGTSAVINANRFQFPTDASSGSRDQCLLLRWGHGIIADKMREVGTPLRPLPFPGAIYFESHGDNDSHFGVTRFKWPGWRKFLGSLAGWRRFTNRIRTQFSMTDDRSTGQRQAQS